jgi:hypothetical protein
LAIRERLNLFKEEGRRNEPQRHRGRRGRGKKEEGRKFVGWVEAKIGNITPETKTQPNLH